MLRTRVTGVEALYADDFEGFMKARQQLLMGLVSRVTGQVGQISGELEEGGNLWVLAGQIYLACFVVFGMGSSGA
mgnify:CR=1 FL=1